MLKATIVYINMSKRDFAFEYILANGNRIEEQIRQKMKIVRVIPSKIVLILRFDQMPVGEG